MTTRDPDPVSDPDGGPDGDARSAHDGRSDPDGHGSLDPRQEARVRDLLRTLATLATDHDPLDVPMPPEVLARLQSALATEGAARPGALAPGEPDAPVELAARRRGASRATPGSRRRGLAAAAAAAVVLAGAAGVAAATHGLRAGSSGEAGSSASAGGAVRTLPSESPSPSSSGSAGSSSSAGSDASRGLGTTPGPTTSAPSGAGRTGLPVLSRSRFARDVTALLRSATSSSAGAGSTSSGARRAPTPTPASTPAPSSPAPGTGGSAAPTSPYAGCTPPRTTPGSQLRAVRLDGSPAVLVLGPVLDGGRVATAWSCSGRAPLVSARVTPPR